MNCPSEFSLALYADGESASEERSQLLEHLRQCAKCRGLASALEEESLWLTESLRKVNRVEVGASASEPQAVAVDSQGWGSVVRLGAHVLSLSLLLRMSLDVLTRFRLPVGLDWLHPFSLSRQLSLLTSGILYVFGEGGSMILSLVNGLGFLMFSLICVAGLVLLLRRMSSPVSVLVLLTLLVVFARPSYAIDIRTPQEGIRGSVTVAPGEIIDDTLVVFGESVNVDGTITGDLVAFARRVSVRGGIGGNLISFAQRIDVSGEVGGDIFAFSESMQLDGRVAESLWSFGESTRVDSRSQIGDDATMFGADMSVDGEIGRDLTMFGAELEVGGTVGGDVGFRGETISLLSTAVIAGDLAARVEDEEDIQVDPRATIGGERRVELREPEPSEYARPGFYVVQALRIAAAFGAGLLLFWIFPAAGRVGFDSSRAVLTAGGVGFLGTVATPVAALVLAMTLVGLPVAGAVITLWIAGLYLAKIVVAQFLGRRLFRPASDALSSSALGLLAGLVVIIVAVNLPFVGSLANILLTVIGFGALSLAVYGAWAGGSVSAETVEPIA